MIPFWFLPYAIACGNTVVVKPSERVPLTMQKVFALLDRLRLPPGVVNLVNGGREAVDAILDHPSIRAVSFVGSSAVARHVYSRGAAAGKRVQCQGGAKNPVVVLPDADLASASEIVADSAFGCAGQRCLAASVAITVGDARKPFIDAMRRQAPAARHRLRPGRRRADGPGDHAGEPRAHRGLDRPGGQRRRPRGRGRPPAGHGAVRATATSCARPCSKACRSRARSPARRSSDRCCRCTTSTTIDEAIAFVNSGRLRQPGVPVHDERRQRAQVPLRGGGRQRRHQCRRRGADGLLPVQRRARELLRRPARPGPRRDRVLHAGEGRRRTLAEGVVAEVLRRAGGRESGVPSTPDSPVCEVPNLAISTRSTSP